MCTPPTCDNILWLFTSNNKFTEQVGLIQILDRTLAIPIEDFCGFPQFFMLMPGQYFDYVMTNSLQILSNSFINHITIQCYIIKIPECHKIGQNEKKKYMEHNPSSASQEIPHISQKLHIHCHVHNESEAPVTFCNMLFSLMSCC
jgi:hypothetical protein